MAARNSVIRVSVVSDTKAIRKGVDDVNSKLSSMGRAAAGAAKLAVAAFATSAIASGVRSIVSAASDAQQSLGATEAIFGKFSNTVIKTSNNAAKAYGLSANQYRESANLLGALFKNQGVAQDKLAGKTKNMVGVAADLSAMYGGTAADAVSALTGAFKGEFDPLEKYGISIKQSSVNTEAAAVAQSKFHKALKDLTPTQAKQAQQIATTNLLMKQSKDAQGGFARETDTLAHQQQVLSAQFDNLKVTLGTALLPVFTKVLTFINNNFNPAIAAIVKYLTPVIASVKQFFKGLGDGQGQMGGLTTFITGQVLPAISGIWTAFQNLVTVLTPIVQQVVDVFTSKWSQIAPLLQQVWTNVQQIITSALSIIQSVIGIYTNLIQAIWSRFGATILSYLSGTLNNLIKVISGVFNIIAGLFRTVAALLQGDWSGAWDGIKQITKGALSVLQGVLGQLVNILKTAVKLAWDAAKAAFTTGVNAVVTLAKGIGGKIKAGIGNLKDLLINAGQDIIQGLIDGINDKVDDVKGLLNKVTDLIPDWKGPKDKDKRLLFKPGQWIIDGLVKGLRSGEGDVRSYLGDLTNKIKDAFKGKRESKALSVLKTYTPQILKVSKAYDAVSSSLDTWNKKLQDAQQAYDSFKSSVASSITGMFNPFQNLLDVPSTGSIAGNIAANASAQLTGIKNLINRLNALKAKGAPQSLLMQILGLGADQGVKVADALLGSPSTLTQLKSAFSQIDSLSNSFGKSMADTFYGHGVNVAKGMVAGLKSQQKALESQMESLGDAIVKQIKKKLGIHSPSRVFRDLGKQTSEGLVIGLQDVNVKRSAQRLASDLTTGFGQPQLAASATGGSATPSEVHIHIEGGVFTGTEAQFGALIKKAWKAHDASGGRTSA